MSTLTRVSSNKSNITRSVSSGIQTSRSGLKKRDDGKFFFGVVVGVFAYWMKH